MDPAAYATFDSRKGMILVVGLVLAHLAYALCLNPWGRPISGSNFERLLGYARLGVSFSQPLLLAVFAALAPCPLVKQVPAALLGVALLTSVGFDRNTASAELLTATALSIGLYAVEVVPLAVFRLRGWVIFAQDGVAPKEVGEQLGMRWLLLLTTAAALTCMVSHYMMAGKAPVLLPTVLQLVAMIGVYSVTAVGPTLFAAAVLGSRPVAMVLLGSGMIVAGTWLTAEIATTLEPSITSFLELILAFATIQAGIVAGIVLSLLPLRFYGYRLVRRPQ